MSRKCPKGYKMSNGVCTVRRGGSTSLARPNYGTPIDNRNDCCSIAMDQFQDCYESYYTMSPSCSKPGCQCASFPAYQFHVSANNDHSVSYTWNETHQQWIGTMPEFFQDTGWFTMYNCQCHPTQNNAATMVGCCGGGGRGGGTAGSFGSRGGWRRGGKIKRRRGR